MHNRVARPQPPRPSPGAPSSDWARAISIVPNRLFTKERTAQTYLIKVYVTTGRFPRVDGCARTPRWIKFTQLARTHTRESRTRSGWGLPDRWTSRIMCHEREQFGGRGHACLPVTGVSAGIEAPGCEPELVPRPEAAFCSDRNRRMMIAFHFIFSKSQTRSVHTFVNSPFTIFSLSMICFECRYINWYEQKKRVTIWVRATFCYNQNLKGTH